MLALRPAGCHGFHYQVSCQIQSVTPILFLASTSAPVIGNTSAISSRRRRTAVFLLIISGICVGSVFKEEQPTAANECPGLINSLLAASSLALKPSCPVVPLAPPAEGSAPLAGSGFPFGLRFHTSEQAPHFGPWPPMLYVWIGGRHGMQRRFAIWTFCVCVCLPRRTALHDAMCPKLKISSMG